MNSIRRFKFTGGTVSLAEEAGDYVLWVDVKRLLNQLPEEMQHCTIRFIECKKGHGRLTATNWVDHGCDTCALEEIKAELNSVRALALAAVQLLPEDTPLGELTNLKVEAREVFLGKDKETIAKLQDEIFNLQQALLHAQRPTRTGITAVYGVRRNDKAEIGYALQITELRKRPDGGAEVEVLLP